MDVADAKPSEAVDRPHQSDEVDVAVAIVSHRHYNFLEPCLASLFENTRQATIRVMLVDNVGEPPIRELVESRFPTVQLTVNAECEGFSQNNNAVLREARARHYFLLNPDTVLHAGALDTLVAYLDAHPAVGACAPKLLYPNGSLQLSCRRFPSLGAVVSRRTPLRRWLGDSRFARRYTMADWNHAECRCVDWVFGAAILIRRPVWESVGPLDEGMFMYCEDIDWCMRCQLAGWELHYVPDARIIHHLDDGKYNEYLSKTRRQHYRTMLQFFLKYPRCCFRW